MKNYEPTFEKFYQVNIEDTKFADRIIDDDSPKGIGGFAEKFLKRFWTAPTQDGESVVWTSLYLKQLAASWLTSPLGFVNKLLSLTVLPAFWSIVTWTFSTFAMGVQRPMSCYSATFIFLLTLRDSVLSLPARPTFRAFFKLFCHQAALKWMMWCVGLITHLYSFNEFNQELKNAKIFGLIAAAITYLFTIDNVAYRDGAANTLRYIGQVVAIGICTFFSTIAGFFVAIAVQQPTWKCLAGAFFFGFIGFWIAVNLFYWPFGWKFTGLRDRGEPLIRE